MESVRLDKWLWAVRVFKTRADAAEACQGGKVILNQHPAKPASKVRIGDALTVATHFGRRMVKVTALTDRRVGAALVPEYLLDEHPKPKSRPPANCVRNVAPSARKPSCDRPKRTGAIGSASKAENSEKRVASLGFCLLPGTSQPECPPTTKGPLP